MIERLEAQKKLTSNQWKLICTANVADLLDFFDFFLIGYITAALTKEWSLTYWPGGGMLAGLVSAWRLPLIGWRYLFLVGLSPLVLVFMIRYWVPESPRWLMRAGRHEEARKSLAWALMIDPREISLPQTVEPGQK